MSAATAAKPQANKNGQPVEKTEPNEPTPFLDKVVEATIAKVAATGARCFAEMAKPMDTARKAMVTAQALDELRAVLSPEVMKRIMTLQNSPLGFLTDKREGGYPTETVKECVIEALLAGVAWTGNEFNIIAGRCYITQNGYARKVRELDGLTALELIPGMPGIVNGQPAVRVAARWLFDGKPMQFADGEGKPGQVFTIIARNGATPDNYIGKAKRKALKAIYDRCTGSESPDDDADFPLTNAAASATAGATKTDQIAANMAARKAAKEAPAPDPTAIITDGPPPADLPAVKAQQSANPNDPWNEADEFEKSRQGKAVDGQLYGGGDADEGPHGEKR